MQLESAGDPWSHDQVETIVDLGMGSVVRITITTGHVEWQFMEAGSSREQVHRVMHYEAKGRGINL